MPLRNVPAGTATPIYNSEGRNVTNTHLSTNIYVAVDGIPVAAVSSITINEKRQIEMIDEIGTDGHVDSAPRSSTDISGSCKRTRFAGKRIAEAFRRGFVHVSAQRVPFDIQIYDLIQGDENNVIITTIKNVWINGIDYSYEADNFIIIDNMGWEAESIESVRGNSGAETALGDPTSVILNPFEVQADIGKYRGALDAAGFLNAFDNNGSVG
jgi:hypothetical protein